MYVEIFTAFFAPCSCQSLDTYKLASYIHSYHLPFGELRNWQYSHSVALSGHRTGEILSSRSLDSNTSSVLKTTVSPVPTEEESLKSCADEFPAICITWPILARIIRAVARIVERSSARQRYVFMPHVFCINCTCSFGPLRQECSGLVQWWWCGTRWDQGRYKKCWVYRTRGCWVYMVYKKRMMKSLLHWMQNKERVEATNDDMAEKEELYKPD